MAFQKIKTILSKEPVLTIFYLELKMALHTHARFVGVGAIVFQIENGRQKVIVYFIKQTLV